MFKSPIFLLREFNGDLNMFFSELGGVKADVFQMFFLFRMEIHKGLDLKMLG